MTIDLETLHLASGGHDDRGQGVCLLEAVAWFAGKEHTDRPPCVSPVLGAYGRALNDVLSDDTRQQLIPYIPGLPGTAGDGKDKTRRFIALDWLLRSYVPAWCDLVPALAGDAAALRGLPRIADLASEQAAIQVLQAVRDNAGAAWDAAGDAAGAAAGDAAWDAAGAAARAALAPTVAQLQESAVSLFAALIAGEWPDGEDRRG